MMETRPGPESEGRSDEETAGVLSQERPRLDPRQVAAWRAMSPAERLDIGFQAYQFALEAVRTTERERNPHISRQELAWRVTRRMQGDPELGR